MNNPAPEVKLTTYKCPQCVLEFPGMPNLNRHIVTAHLKSHLASSTSTSYNTTTNALRCSLCSASADTVETLSTHFTRHILYRCLECDSTFESPAELIAHRSDHLEEMIFNCDKCDFKSKTRSELRGHERIHNNSQSLICMECDFLSKSTTEFAQHLQTHTSNEMVQCNICSTKFGKTTELREHMVIHYSRSRTRLARKPTPIAPESGVLSSMGTFHCYYCSYKCSMEDQMTKHIQGVHVTPSGSSEQHDINHDKNEEKKKDLCQIQKIEANVMATDSARLVLPKMAQTDSCTQLSSVHTQQPQKILECNHCPCNSYGFRWMRNMECHYQPLTHFMNPSDTDFSGGLQPFNPSKCGSCSMLDSHIHTEVPTDSGSIQAPTTDDLLVTNIDDPLISNSGNEEHDFQTNSSNSDLNQTATTTEPNMKELKTEHEPSIILEIHNFENEDKTGNLKLSNVRSSEDEGKGAEILLSKLRQFFNESFPKISCPSEGDSDQSTLTANTSGTQDILTIELSSDSNASDHSY